MGREGGREEQERRQVKCRAGGSDEQCSVVRGDLEQEEGTSSSSFSSCLCSSIFFRDALVVRGNAVAVKTIRVREDTI